MGGRMCLESSISKIDKMLEARAETNWPEIDEVLWKIMSRCQCQVHGACLDARLPPTLLSTQLQKKKVQNGNTNPCSTIRDCCNCHCSDDGNLCSVVQKTLQQKCSTTPLWNPQSCFWYWFCAFRKKHCWKNKLSLRRRRRRRRKRWELSCLLLSYTEYQ